jgi:hypothetical protein
MKLKQINDYLKYVNSLKLRKNKFGAMSEQTECPLCLEPFGSGYYKKTVVKPYRCEHKYHESCIAKWNRECPMCRENSSRSDYLINQTLIKYHIEEIKMNDLIWIKEKNLYIKGSFVKIYYSGNKVYIRLHNVKVIMNTKFNNFEIFDVEITDNIEFIRIIVNL